MDESEEMQAEIDYLALALRKAQDDNTRLRAALARCLASENSSDSFDDVMKQAQAALDGK